MNLDIDHVIEFFFPHKYDFLYRMGLDGILVFLLLLFELVPK